MNGIIITITAFLIFSYSIKDMSFSQKNSMSNDVGNVLVERISSLENVVRLITTIVFLSEGLDRDDLASEIRRNVAGLSQFDQLFWLYENNRGEWQYKTIFKSTNNKLMDNSKYNLKFNKRLLEKLEDIGFSDDKGLRIVSDFDGMDYVQTSTEPSTIARPFALIKVVKEKGAFRQAIIGVTRAAMIFDQRIITENDAISRLTIHDVISDRRIYHMERVQKEKYRSEALKQNYSFFIGDSEWEIILEFTKNKDIMFLEKVPYAILLFGIILTVVGTLFIRNNHRQSERLGSMNTVLEQKNRELQAEIDGRERLNTTLTNTERDNRAIIDAVSDVIFETDIEGNIIFLSAAWHKITGFEIESSEDRDLFSMFYPDDQDKQRHDFKMFVERQKQAYRSFTRLRVSDGTFRAVELAISMIRRDKDKNLRVVGTITDVEKRRQAERALAEAEKKYRTIVENAAGGLYQLTPEGMYLSANPAMARILGYNSPAEMLRMIKNANGFVYPDVEERKKFIDILAEQDQIFGYESEVLSKDGRKIWVRENVRLVKDDEGNALYLKGLWKILRNAKKPI